MKSGAAWPMSCMKSTAQVLATVAMNLSVLGDADRAEGCRESKLIDESAGLVRNLLGEVRQLSDLLHPPTLDEIGLPSAIQWYADRFAKRSNIKVTVEIRTLSGGFLAKKRLRFFEWFRKLSRTCSSTREVRPRRFASAKPRAGSAFKSAIWEKECPRNR